MSDDDKPPRRPARLEVADDDDDARADRRLIVRADKTSSRLELPGDEEPPPPPSAFEPKLPFFGYDEAEARNRGALSTAQALAVRDPELIVAAGHAAVRAQIARFLDDLRENGKTDNRFRTAVQKLPNYEAWRKQMVALADAAAGAEVALDELVRTERRERERRDLLAFLAHVLDDNELSHDEHVLVRRKAAQYGYDDDALAALYDEYRRTVGDFVGPLPPVAGTAPPAPPWRGKTKTSDWRFEDLRNAFIDDFAIAVKFVNEDPDHRHSLIAYLEREFADHVADGEHARNAAIACECRPLAVWHFLWATGLRSLPLVASHRPDADRSVSSPAELLERAGRDYLLDDLGAALHDGLLEHWLRFSGVDATIVSSVSDLRNRARGRTDRQRPSFLRKAAIQVLWWLGFRGLPLWSGPRVTVVTSVTELVTHGEACWDAIAWCVEHDVLGDWLDGVSRADATRARAATRAVAAKQAIDLATWSFLWSSGSRRLLLAAKRPAVPDPRDGVVDGLDGLREIIDGGTRAAAIDSLLQGGFIEAWLREAVREERLATATAQIVADDRRLKAERFAQLIGCTQYQVAGVPVSSIADFAQLPLKVADPMAIWDHIREGVPQERFRGQLNVVRVLDEIRGERSLSDAAKALVACLRLGLRTLPYAGGRLERASDVADLLDAKNGREVLHELLTSGVLEAWADRIIPGSGARVASMKAAPAYFAADRVARILGDRSVHTVIGRRAADRASITFGDLTDPLARARVRDALFGPVPIADVPGDLTRLAEEDLASWPAAEHAQVFGWIVLRLPTLGVGGRPIDTIEQLITAIAEPAARAEVTALAASGILGVWIEKAQRRALPTSLQGKVAPGRFPVLAIELGEEPPALEFHWSRRTAAVADGQGATFELVVINRDPLRTAQLELEHAAPSGLTISHLSLLVVDPGEEARIILTLQPARGNAGEMSGEITLHHAHPDRPLPARHTTRLTLAIGFPWQPLAAAAAAWTVLGALTMYIVRVGLESAAREPGAVGAAVALLAVAIERFAVWRITDKFWLHDHDRSDDDGVRVGSVVLFLVLGIKECRQADSGDGAVAVVAVAMLVSCLYLVARRDLLAVAVFVVMILARRTIGELTFEGAVAMDRTLGGFGSSPQAAMVGWTITGAVAGLSTGIAIGFRAIDRPKLGEVLRVAVLLVAILICVGVQ